MSESVWKFMRENELRIENEVSKELECKICNKLMIKACHAPCGCRFCSDCIEHYLDGKDKFCPGTARNCQNRMINYAKDIAIDWPINIHISEIVVKCPRQNCEIQTELVTMEDHMKTCDKRPISCPFTAIGCGMNEVVCDEMNAHLNESNHCHVKLLIDRINKFENQMESMTSKNDQLTQRMCLMEEKDREKQGEIERLKGENDKLNQQLNAMKLRMCHASLKANDNIQLCRIDNSLLSDEMTKLNAEISQSKRQIESIEKQIETSQTKSERQIDAFKQNCEQQQLQHNINIQNEMEKCANKIPPIQTKFGNAFINFGILDWQIDKLSQLKRNKLIYSEPFYSGPGGYKMCLALDISDDGAILVRFCLMRGDCDAGLEWPFRYSVTIHMINPANGNVYFRQSLKCPKSFAAVRWVRPASDRIDPVNNVFNDYINLSDIKNDKLLLKCIIKK